MTDAMIEKSFKQKALGIAISILKKVSQILPLTF
jgi:hypothetical protein